jgi:uncharacterized protein YjgD (DUF1641 family)
MAQPILLNLAARNPRAELQLRLQNAPLEHAEALLSTYEVLQGLHDRGVFELMRGTLGSSDKVLEIIVEAAKAPESIRGMRNLIIISKLFASIEPELLEGLASSLPQALTKKPESKPPSLWQLLKKMFSRDTRRALGAMLEIFESFGKSLGLAAAKDVRQTESVAEPPRSDR